MQVWLTVVGIGDDGYDGLARASRRALFDASEIHGGERQLALLPARIGAVRRAWPHPFTLDALLARRGTPTCVLASGDPMFHGVGATLARQVAMGEMRVLPAPSSVSLAAARLGWPLQQTATVSLLSAPVASLAAHVEPGRRLFVLSADGQTPARVAAWLAEHGFGASPLSVCEHLGGTAERIVSHRADAWPGQATFASLNLIAIACEASDERVSWPWCSGLPDEAFRHDGQLTKRDVRAVTLARLAPVAGQLLWDVGGGSGSIGIEWMRAHPSCRAIAIEADAGRQAFITHNRDALGVPSLQLVAGHAPKALAGLPAPDAVFIGGGVTVEGMLETCWDALRPGGRLVVNAVTVQAEQRVIAWRDRHGGSLTRIALSHAQPLGGFDTWRGALPITLYEATKP